ncbi:MAG: DoxX family protein, partial [Bacteroidota bacterium]|nr:DoxX family protein [Bacteroidota bacterium]
MAILLLRITAGAFMLTHGIGKFSLLFGNEAIQFPDPIGVGATASLALAVFSEVLCSLFLILGIATRLSAIP